MSSMQLDGLDVSSKALMIVGMIGSEPTAVLHALGLSLQSPYIQIFDTPATLRVALEASLEQDVHILALATSCDAYLAGSITAGLNPIPAGEAWQAVASDFLAFCQTYRGALMVLDTYCACSIPGATRRAIEDRFSLKLAGIDSVCNRSTAVPVINLLAQDMTRRDIKLRRVQSELEAITQPLDGMVKQPAPDAANILQGIRATQEELLQAKAIANESTQTTASLQQKLKAAEVSMSKIVETSQLELHKVRLDLANARQLYSVTEDRHVASITRLQARLESILAAEHKNTVLRQDLNTALQLTRSEVSDLRNSTSWKITGPARRIRRIMSLRKYRAK